jgi:hypothetical protein
MRATRRRHRQNEDMETTAGPDRETERRLAADLFHQTWRLLEMGTRTPEQDDEMIHCAHASRYHWGHIGQPVNLARGEWQIARVYAALGRGEPAPFHARRCLRIAQTHQLGAFDVAAAYEALARAHWFGAIGPRPSVTSRRRNALAREYPTRRISRFSAATSRRCRSSGLALGGALFALYPIIRPFSDETSYQVAHGLLVAAGCVRLAAVLWAKSATESSRPEG